jgi:hypothetical protein
MVIVGLASSVFFTVPDAARWFGEPADIPFITVNTQTPPFNRRALLLPDILLWCFTIRRGFTSTDPCPDTRTIVVNGIIELLAIPNWDPGINPTNTSRLVYACGANAFSGSRFLQD